MLKRALYQPGDALREAELFGPEPDHDMALAFVQMCRDMGWTIEDSLALARKIWAEGERDKAKETRNGQR